MKTFKNLIYFLAFMLITNSVLAQKNNLLPAVWSPAKANTWYAQYKWISGANFIPSTAINQLEMWQASTFGPQTIDRELGWAEGIGFNTMRVFLHSVAYTEDPAGFKQRVNRYLTIADKHHIKTIFVFFDDCWNPDPRAGKQPEPKTGVHNSGWVQDPGTHVQLPAHYPVLEKYVKDVVKTFAHDKRILLWDVFNEPGNSDKGDKSLPLLARAFEWARSSHPEQPVSSGIWKWELEKLNAYQISHSDVITYHDYEDEKWHLRVIEMLKTHGKPLICTEYMARTRGSRFANIMPMLKAQHVGAINWGLVAGKTNTIYAWDTPMPNGEEPKIWFHEVFRKDGTPYLSEETELIKSLNNK